jgi:diadenosine tetraphosphate (Ap4A) HIT family hydrolase
MPACPFCNLPPERIVAADELCVVIRDAFPISDGHTLVIPRRHVGSFFELTEQEHASALRLLRNAHEQLKTSKPAFTSDFNIGINDGPAAGQTVPHVHLHLIPRNAGDVVDARGGVRWVIPQRARYWKDPE